MLTGIVQQLWPHINKAVCKAVKESVEPSFSDLSIGTLKTLHFTHLDLGMTPVSIDNVVVHDKEQDDSLQKFDMDLVWDGDCNIQLKADYLGSFGVQKIKFHGRLSVVLSPLLDVMPVVSAAQVCFINAPKFELDFLGIANLADFSLIDNKIRNIISDIINDMLVLPNRMYFKIDPANSFLDTYKPPIGVARVTIVNGTGFQATGGGFMKEAHDVYCIVNMGGNNNSKKQWQTSTINNTGTPEWNETKDFLLYDYDQIIQVHAWDEDVAGADDDLGMTQVTVREMLLAPGKKKTVDLHGGTYKGGKLTLQCQVCKLDLVDLDSLEANQDKNLLSGLVTVLVVGAKNIPGLEKKDAKTFVKVKYGPKVEFVTATVVDGPGVDCLNPTFDKAFEIPLTPSSSSKNESIEIFLMNDKDTVLGSTTVTHDELTEAGSITVHELSIGEHGASLEFRVSIYGVVKPDDSVTFLSAGEGAKAHATTSSVTSSNSKGTVRLTVLNGWGFEVETRRRLIKRKDIPDAYCNITFGSSPNIWRTKTIPNSTTPEWNESADYLLSDHSQIICLTVFDQDKKRDKDDELGGARVSVGKLLLEGTMDIELLDGGKPTGQYIALKCDMLSPS